MSFTRTIAIDWSGAKGSKHKGIAIAEAREGEPPRLIRPGHVWSRSAVLGWLMKEAEKEPTLFGFDFSFAPPIHERGDYFPGEKGVPREARELWAYVDRHSDDEDLGAASFLEQHHRPHFYFGATDGVKADFIRWRRCDKVLREEGGGKGASAYDAIGAAQVAKASFAGMRLLHALGGKVAIWPMEAIRESESAVVEIYTRLFIRLAGMSGNKIRDRKTLNAALANLGSPPWRGRGQPSDHQTDVLVSAAGMLTLLREGAPFCVPALDEATARTEGWTFGVGCAKGAKEGSVPA